MKLLGSLVRDQTGFLWGWRWFNVYRYRGAVMKTWECCCGPMHIRAVRAQGKNKVFRRLFCSRRNDDWWVLG